jgi:hypothetical protein
VRTKLNANLMASQAPGSPMGTVYLFADEAVGQGFTYHYWVEALDFGGRAAHHGPVSATVPAMSRLLLARPRLVPSGPSLSSQ